MAEYRPQEVQKTLQKTDVHDSWASSYRTPENEAFYERAFDCITKVLNAPTDSTILDAGCGTCAQSVRLARRGFRVTAVDFSDAILARAEQRVKSLGLEGRIRLQREDVVSLSFEDETFDYVLCWGVLMHIPEVDKAVSELARVVKRGGSVIISEGNMYSLDSFIVRNVKRMLWTRGGNSRKTPAGIEMWMSTSAGSLLVRHANVPWLIWRFANMGFTLQKRVPGQFTELYTKMPTRVIRKLIRRFNDFWFRFVGIPQPAFGNILILRKENRSLPWPCRTEPRASAHEHVRDARAHAES